MSDVINRIQCNDCKEWLDGFLEDTPENRLPCPLCGSKSRSYHLSIKEEICLKSSLRFVHTDPNLTGRKKRKAEGISGDSLYRATGQWNERSYLIDREKGTYTETIKDGKTGEIIHHLQESLADHQGHGSAKKQS
jgi:hypothetical protein